MRKRKPQAGGRAELAKPAAVRARPLGSTKWLGPPPCFQSGNPEGVGKERPGKEQLEVGSNSYRQARATHLDGRNSLQEELSTQGRKEQVRNIGRGGVSDGSFDREGILASTAEAGRYAADKVLTDSDQTSLGPRDTKK